MKTILDIDPNDRKIIRVGDFNEIKFISPNKKLSMNKVKNLGKLTDKGVSGKVVAGAALSLVPLIGAASLITAAGVVGIKNLIENKDSSEVSYIEVPIKQASKLFKWKGTNTPEKNRFYIKSPHNDNVYILASEFHTVLFEEKFNEVIAILEELKPKSILVEFKEGYSKEIKTKVGFQKDGVNASGNFEKDSRVEMEIMYKSDYKKPENLERHGISSNLICYTSEVIWQRIVEGVTNCGMEHVEMDIMYEDDFGVNSDLALSITKVAGGNIAVKFASFKKTHWKVKATFW